MIGAQADYKRAIIIEQLEKYGYRDTDDKSYRELVNQLSRLRAISYKDAYDQIKQFDKKENI